MPDASLDRLSAALADRYRVERELGAGGMATVYRAEDLKHRRQVAIKVLKPELAAALGSERFLHEIEVTAKLQHTFLLNVDTSTTEWLAPAAILPHTSSSIAHSHPLPRDRRRHRPAPGRS